MPKKKEPIEEDGITFIEKEEEKIENEYQKDALTFKKYVKKVFDIRRPFLIKTDLNKKDVGYHFYLKEYTNLLRYFNVDTKYWKEYNILGGLDKTQISMYDKTPEEIVDMAMAENEDQHLI